LRNPVLVWPSAAPMRSATGKKSEFKDFSLS
jgi:hypothetical protein